MFYHKIKILCCVFCHKTRLCKWILRYAQYDKEFVIARICKAWACKFVAIHWNFLWCAWGRLAEFLGFLRLCLNFCDKVCLNLWIATLALLARNDRKRKRTLSFFIMTAHSCHFERSALAQSEKSTEFKICLKFKAKNPYFDFMDTSLCYAKFSMTKFRLLFDTSPKFKARQTITP